MKDISKYQGIIPAFYACYDREGAISPQATEDLTRYMVEKGVKGVYVGGSSGECIYHSDGSGTCDEGGRGKTYGYCSRGLQ